MNRRILVGGFMHEVNTFADGFLTLEDMRRNGYVALGDAMLGPGIGADQEIHGAMAVALAAGAELVPSLHAYGGVGPRVRDDAYVSLREGILDVARAERAHIDGVYLVLHGAMATETEDDPEGDTLERLRRIVGPDVPIVASCDLHAHVTERMTRSADALIAYRTIPHVDFVQTGQRSMRLLLDAVERRTHPVTRQRKLRMTASSERHDTNHGPMVEVMARARESEGREGILAVSVIPTQPWMDVPELGWSVVAVSDGDPDLAQATADELAWMIWDRRERFLVTKTPVQDAVQEAMRTPGRPVVLADGADSPSAGANGDGNDLLRELVRIGYQGQALLAIADPAAAEACHVAGVGATVTVALGGALTPSMYRPVEVTGVVEAVRDGRYLLELPVRPVDIGPTAVVRIGDMRVVVSTRKAFHLDESVFHQAGLDPRSADIVQAKSAGGFRGVYEAFAARIIEMETAGLTSHDLTMLPFRNLDQPMWPWHADLAQPWPGAVRPGDRRETPA